MYSNEPIDRVLAKFPDAKRSGNNWIDRCPAHDDKNPSLSIGVGDDGRVLLYCHAGCSHRDICSAIGIDDSDLFGEREHWRGNGVHHKDATTDDIVARLCQIKNMSLESALKYGAKPAMRAGRYGERPVVRFPVFDNDAREHSYFDISPDAAKSDKLCKGLLKEGKGSSGIFIPGRSPLPGETWHLVEGVKDAAALDGLGYLSLGLPGAKLPVKFAKLLEGVHVVIVHDLDTPGVEGAEHTAATLSRVAASVRIARLPGEITPSGGQDVRDVLQREGGEQAVRDAIASAKEWELPPDDGGDGRPVVELRTDQYRTIDEVLPPLGNLGWNRNGDEGERIYQRGGCLVQVGEKNSIRLLPKSILGGRISKAVRLLKQHKGNLVPAHPTPWLINQIFDRGEWPSDFRVLNGVADAPVLRADGSIAQTPGYDARLGLEIRLSGDWPTIPTHPTCDERRAAMSVLRDVFSDFPFLDDAHRSSALAYVLTLVARHAIAGPVPLFLFDANTRGSGKSLLADVGGLIATGSVLHRTTWTDDENECRKKLTSIAIEARPVVLLDNITGKLGNGTLDAALTSVAWSDRILGENRSVNLPWSTVLVATGNNIRLAADTSRRVILSRLESAVERPEDRSDFQHADLLGYVRENRKSLYVAALTILRGHYLAEAPVPLTPFGSFECWSKVVRGAIVGLGLPDPLLTRKQLHDADETEEKLRIVVEALSDYPNGLTAAEWVEEANRQDDLFAMKAAQGLRDSLEALCGANPEKLSYELRRMRGRVFGGRKLIAEDTRTRAKRWRTTSA